MKVIAFFFVLFLAFISTAYADVLYVHSAKAPLFETAAFNSTRLMTLAKGDQVVALAQEKRWAKVQFGDVEGWVPALLVNTDPPIDKVNLIGSDTITIEGQARQRASAVATAGATRGLTEGEGANGLASDYSELELMESINLTTEQVDSFSAQVWGAEQ
jgi:hypothetical protein